MSAHKIDAAARLEDVRFMADTGETLTGAARRLGITRDALERWLQRRDTAALHALGSREGDELRRECGRTRRAS